MRKLSMLAFLAVTTASWAAFAAPPPCENPLPAWFDAVKEVDKANKGKPKDTWEPIPELVIPPGAYDCMRDDVLVLNGEAMGGGKVLATCKAGDDCTLDYEAVIARALEVIGAAPTQWDQFVIFGQQSPKTDPPGPLFFRSGVTVTTDPVTKVTSATGGVNEVAGINLPMNPRVMGRPFVGYIAAGGTNQMAKFAAAGSDGWMKDLKKDDFRGAAAGGSYGPCGKVQSSASAAPDDAKNPAICYGGFYNFFDALAQATGAMFGPYLKGPKDPAADPMTMKVPASPLLLSASPVINPDTSAVAAKTGFVSEVELTVNDPMTMMPMMKKVKLANALFAASQPRFWNSFVDMQGSLFAGNTYRDNSNGTFETTKPPPYYGINVPFPAGWANGTVLSGSQILRFQPLDLYVMGFAGPDELPAEYRSFVTLTAPGIYRDGRANPPTAFDGKAGPQMGLRTGLVLRPGAAIKAEDQKITSAQLLMLNGTRMPAFGQAPQFIKQLWIVVGKPKAAIEGTSMDNDLMKKRSETLLQLQSVGSMRRQFAAYFYMLTQYRGRVVNTFDGVDDNAYFEFGASAEKDATATFAAEGGAEIQQNGWESEHPNTPERLSVLRFNNAPANSGVRFTAKAPVLRIASADANSSTPVNSVAVRMRIPVQPLKSAAATLTLDGAAPVRIPPAPADLVADGKWHTYVAPLTSDEFKAGNFAAFSFSPTDKDAAGIEVDYIRIANHPSLKDADKVGTKCGACSTVPAANRKKCTDACGGKDDSFIVAIDQADGWLDAEDNCPAVYNPLQEDGNTDGIGDACEDFDADGVVNAWDNCPTTTNSRQVDKDGNGVGDVCDGNQATPCFLKPDSLAGPASASPGALLGVLLAGTIGVLAFRRRRRR